MTFIYRFGLGHEPLRKNICNKCKERKRMIALPPSWALTAENLKETQEIEGGN